jgi:large subunit ribosomal protein L21
MTYVVIKISGTQYKASLGEELLVDNLNKSPGDKFEAEEVLMLNDGKNYKVGSPTLTEKVKLEVLENTKGTKIRVATFKAKSRYRKVKGSRPHLTKVKVIEIGKEKATGLKSAPKKETAKKKNSPKKK